MDGGQVQVFGGSGAVGRYLLRRLALRGAGVTALSRTPPPAWAAAWPTIRWQHGALPHVPLLTTSTSTLLSAGPLDAFVAACARTPPAAGARVVALSSMSAVWKRHSPHPGERALATHLLDCEARLRALSVQHGFSVVLLRPTLIYGAGIDRSLTPLLRFAQRWHRLPWPRCARGLRQPVHADDVAAAMLAAVTAPDSATLALPGASCLPFDAVLERLFARLAPQARLLRVPLPMRAAQQACRLGGAPGRIAAALYRSGEDQIADVDDWSRLACVPRAFDPRPEDFLHW